MNKFNYKKYLLKKLRKLKSSFNYFLNDKIQINFNVIRHTDSLYQLSNILKRKSKSVILDVGAHNGETIKKIKTISAKSIVHSFEPSAENYERALKISKSYSQSFVYNFGLGEKNGMFEFFHNDSSTTSSFLPLVEGNPFGKYWEYIDQVKLKKKVKLKLMSLDQWITTQDIRDIDLLKIDTQGFELSVLKGSVNLLSSKKIRNIILEIMNVDVYENQCSFNEIYSFLSSFGYKLKAIVDPDYSMDGYLRQADYIFSF